MQNLNHENTTTYYMVIGIHLSQDVYTILMRNIILFRVFFACTFIIFRTLKIELKSPQHTTAPLRIYYQ